MVIVGKYTRHAMGMEHGSLGGWQDPQKKNTKSGVNPRRLHRKQQANESEADEDIKITSWCFQPNHLKNMLVKLDTFPKVQSSG